jgi:hypothetical protein
LSSGVIYDIEGTINKRRDIMEEQTLYQKVKAVFNQLPIGAKFTSQEMIEKTDGNLKRISVYIGSIRKSGAAVRINKTNPAVYEKRYDFRTEPRKGRVERAREREFTAMEIGTGIVKHIKQLEKTNNDQKECIKSLKNKIDELMKEVQDLKDKLEQSRKNIVVNKKANGEKIRLSL